MQPDAENVMDDLPADPIGAAWLARAFAVEPMVRLPVLSRVGGRRATVAQDGHRLETYPAAMRSAAEPAAHLQFHLRHEVPHLEFLAACSRTPGRPSSRPG